MSDRGPGAIKSVILHHSFDSSFPSAQHMFRKEIPDPQQSMQLGIWEFTLKSIFLNLTTTPPEYMSIKCSLVNNYSLLEDASHEYGPTVIEILHTTGLTSFSSFPQIWYEVNSANSAKPNIILEDYDKFRSPFILKGVARCQLLMRRKQ